MCRPRVDPLPSSRKTNAFTQRKLNLESTPPVLSTSFSPSRMPFRCYWEGFAYIGSLTVTSAAAFTQIVLTTALCSSVSLWRKSAFEYSHRSRGSYIIAIKNGVRISLSEISARRSSCFGGWLYGSGFPTFSFQTFLNVDVGVAFISSSLLYGVEH